MEAEHRAYKYAGLLMPVVLSFWLLAAHYLRIGNLLLFSALLAFPLILVVRRAMIVRIVQCCLVFAAISWMQITYQMLEARIMMGEDWLRMAVIMGGVISFTFLSACSFLHPALERYYGLNSK